MSSIKVSKADDRRTVPVENAEADAKSLPLSIVWISPRRYAMIFSLDLRSGHRGRQRSTTRAWASLVKQAR